ncbi:hypothetical protein K490DRAFT_52781 [Saccharata proteae CBS 121410]|uniref:Uncharacterized protein n=1 Tax=Saccharata proteae CBS 121410 TaxID=1314787 RepID=A0A9P4LZM8_9PEZI|nr:hypothetical protein K490DRAFT_52781 [Saccharata proteae CBS 121410]
MAFNPRQLIRKTRGFARLIPKGEQHVERSTDVNRNTRLYNYLRLNRRTHRLSSSTGSPRPEGGLAVKGTRPTRKETRRPAVSLSTFSGNTQAEAANTAGCIRRPTSDLAEVLETVGCADGHADFVIATLHRGYVCDKTLDRRTWLADGTDNGFRAVQYYGTAFDVVEESDANAKDVLRLLVRNAMLNAGEDVDGGMRSGVWRLAGSTVAADGVDDGTKASQTADDTYGHFCDGLHGYLPDHRRKTRLTFPAQS